ncbi:LamG domain-containing protein [Candidatus Poribacteria bacterium]|nr:LamG domain-containing protein [Candidatus Poribacteria bacterium]
MKYAIAMALTLNWLLRTSGGQTLFDVRAGQPKVGEWVHFAGTYSRADGVGILYINGQEAGREKARIADASVAGDWGLGARVGYNIDNARPFTGMMDDFTLWNVALTPGEVADIMKNGPTTPTAVSPKGKLATTWGTLKRF